MPGSIATLSKILGLRRRKVSNQLRGNYSSLRWSLPREISASLLIHAAFRSNADRLSNGRSDGDVGTGSVNSNIRPWQRQMRVAKIPAHLKPCNVTTTLKLACQQTQGILQAGNT